jgi:hypothetical protein
MANYGKKQTFQKYIKMEGAKRDKKRNGIKLMP